MIDNNTGISLIYASMLLAGLITLAKASYGIMCIPPRIHEKLWHVVLEVLILFPFIFIILCGVTVVDEERKYNETVHYVPSGTPYHERR